MKLYHAQQYTNMETQTEYKMTKSWEILQAFYDKVFDNTDYKTSYDDTISEIDYQSLNRENESITVYTKDGKEYVIRIIATYSPS